MEDSLVTAVSEQIYSNPPLGPNWDSYFSDNNFSNHDSSSDSSSDYHSSTSDQNQDIDLNGEDIVMSRPASDHESGSARTAALSQASARRLVFDEKRLIVYRGRPGPPLPGRLALDVDLWTVPEDSIKDFEKLLNTLHQLGATEDDEQFAILCADGFKIHREFWPFYVGRYQMFYICIIQEESLPQYAPAQQPAQRSQTVLENITNTAGPSNARSASMPAGPDPSMGLPPWGHDLDTLNEVMNMRCNLRDHQDNFIRQIEISVRLGCTMKFLHDRLMRVYLENQLDPPGMLIVYLELRWGPEDTPVYPTANAGIMRVLHLPDLTGHVMKVSPVCRAV